MAQPKVKPHKARQSHLKYKYGIDRWAYAKILTDQNGACAICKIPFDLMLRNPDVDHDHATGKVRGLLCNACNLGLGQFEDELFLLESAANYLRGSR